MTDTLIPTQRPEMMIVSKFASGLGLAETKLPGRSYERFDLESGAQGLRLKDVPIFRSGEFADSMGEIKTWTDLDIQQLAANFSMLSDSGILTKVPLRCDHFSIFSGGLAGQIGYHENVRAETHSSPVDGVEYTYLMADLVVLRPDAIDSVLSGLWTNRSAEIGPYRTNFSNGEARTYEPVLLGTAFVDIPAVEGLDLFAKKEATAYAGASPTIILEESMGATGTNPASGASGTEDKGGATQHSAPRPAFEFRIGETTTSDFAAVQRHIDGQAKQITAQETELTSLRQFQAEAVTKERTAFVTSLKDKNIITAPQAEKFSKLALDMGPEAFETFKSAYADAEPSPLLENYSSSNSVAPGASADTPGSQAFNRQRDTESDADDILREQVRMHAMGGAKHADIEKFACFAKLKAKDSNITVAQILQGK